MLLVFFFCWKVTNKDDRSNNSVLIFWPWKTKKKTQINSKLIKRCPLRYQDCSRRVYHKFLGLKLNNVFQVSTRKLELDQKLEINTLHYWTWKFQIFLSIFIHSCCRSKHFSLHWEFLIRKEENKRKLEKINFFLEKVR